MRYLIMLLLLCPAVLSAQDRLKAMGRTLAAEIRKSDSSSLVKLYGPHVPVGDILAPGYELLHIDTSGTSSPSDDRLILFKYIGPHTRWIMLKTPQGAGRPAAKVDAECDVRLLKWGSAKWESPALGTIKARVLEALCR